MSEIVKHQKWNFTQRLFQDHEFYLEELPDVSLEFALPPRSKLSMISWPRKLDERVLSKSNFTVLMILGVSTGDFGDKKFGKAKVVFLLGRPKVAPDITAWAL